MDKEPFIIKSGKGHSVEIEQGSTHARRKTNVVAPQEDAPEDRVVRESVQEERKLAGLGHHGEDIQSGPGPAAASAELDATPARAGVTQEVMVEGTPATADRASVQAEAAASGDARQGPVVLQEARTEEDARAAKADATSDRYLSGDESRGAQQDARGPKEEALADRFASDSPDALSEEDLRGPAEPGALLTNRQKVESLQAQANRIQVDQSPSLASERALETRPDERLEQPATQADPPQAALPVGAHDDKPRVAVSASQADLPPELEGNLGFAPAAPAEAPGSSLLARVRALRSNMSVTDDRLSKLQGKPPVKP